MNYQKLDAYLLSELGKDISLDAPVFNVFIRTKDAITEDQREELNQVGIFPDEGSVFSAAVSKHILSQLSEKDWVRQISLAQKLSTKD